MLLVKGMLVYRERLVAKQTLNRIEWWLRGKAEKALEASQRPRPWGYNDKLWTTGSTTRNQYNGTINTGYAYAAGGIDYSSGFTISKKQAMNMGLDF